jgi:hypothetical protein
VTNVTVVNTSPVVTVTDLDKQIIVTPPSEIHLDMGVNPPVYNLTGHSIFVGSGGVNGFQVCILALDGTVRPADGFNPTHAGRVIGLANSTQAKGIPAIIQLAGEIENLAWNLVAGEVYYLASGGEISLTPPDTGFVQRIGVAKTSTILVINLGEPVLR